MATPGEGRREGGREGWVEAFLGGCLEVGRYGCQNDGLDEADTMVREGRREGEDLPPTSTQV